MTIELDRDVVLGEVDPTPEDGPPLHEGFAVMPIRLHHQWCRWRGWTMSSQTDMQVQWCPACGLGIDLDERRDGRIHAELNE